MLGDSLHDVALDIWEFGAEAAPAGSVGDLVFGVVGIPASLVQFVSEVLWGFGS
ncbi:hypothetical protein NCCP2495_15080 [Dietzia sp. NCCP-2495]|nr:hypothetical protein NCCP2495_15080 [Dietzia sp. NCCP-2495]